MNQLFSQLALADVHQNVMRNIVSIRESQDLFDDLSDDPAEWALAQQIEDEIKPTTYRSRTPVIDRPFEDAAWFGAIQWPFEHWQASRFSDGLFGVWYGSDSVETTVHESAYHWVRGLLRDAGFNQEAVIGERKVYSVACDAALVDFRSAVQNYPQLLHVTDYLFPQSVGARLHREGHPGLLIPSVRRPEGENFVILNPVVLSQARFSLPLTYRLDGERILVEKTPGVTWMELEAPVA